MSCHSSSSVVWRMFAIIRGQLFDFFYIVGSYVGSCERSIERIAIVKSETQKDSGGMSHADMFYWEFSDLLLFILSGLPAYIGTVMIFYPRHSCQYIKINRPRSTVILKSVRSKEKNIT